MILDHKTHKFDNCPTCKGMALVIPASSDPSLLNKAQAKFAAEWLLENETGSYDWLEQNHPDILELVA